MSKMEFDGIRHKLLPEIIPKQKTEPLLPIPSSFHFPMETALFCFFLGFFIYVVLTLTSCQGLSLI